MRVVNESRVVKRAGRVRESPEIARRDEDGREQLDEDAAGPQERGVHQRGAVRRDQQV